MTVFVKSVYKFNPSSLGVNDWFICREALLFENLIEGLDYPRTFFVTLCQIYSSVYLPRFGAVP